MNLLWLLPLAGYLVGSVSSAVLVARLFAMQDPRGAGSGNPGATNMLRIGGRRAGALTLLGDMLKGLLPLLLGQALGAGPELLALTGLACFLGHLYPLWFGFQGGKGVATALGVSLGLDWRLGLAVILTWLLVAGVARISSLAALVAGVLLPAYAWLLGQPPLALGALALMALLLFVRHRGNIRRLLAGTESRIGR